MTHGIFDVRDYGAQSEAPEFDNVPAFHAARDAAAALSAGGVVLAPPGEYYLSGYKNKSNVTLMGYGPSTILRLMAGITGPLISLDSMAVNHTVLRDLRLRGNKYSTGGGLNAHGIHYHTAEETDGVRAFERFKFHGDAQHRIFNVTVDGFSGTAAKLFTRECHVDHCHFADCAGDGLVLDGSDNWVSNTSINWIGRRGIVILGGSNKLSMVKAWYIGTDATYNSADGLFVRSSHNTIIGCELQDISRIGVNILGGDSNLINMTMDNIGNLFLRTGMGFEHPVNTVFGVYFDMVSAENGADRNQITAAIYQRTPQVGMDFAVKFRSAARDNQVFITCDPSVVRNGLLNKGNERTQDNMVVINNRLC